jgi:hypothetical protein
MEGQRVIVMSQACELCKRDKQTKGYTVQNIVVCPMYRASEITTNKGKINEIKAWRVPGLAWLPSCLKNGLELLPKSILDFRQMYTVHRAHLESMREQQQRLLSVGLLYRERLSAAFAQNYARIGVPSECEEFTLP